MLGCRRTGGNPHDEEDQEGPSDHPPDRDSSYRRADRQGNLPRRQTARSEQADRQASQESLAFVASLPDNSLSI